MIADLDIKIAGLQDNLRAIFQKVEFRVLFGLARYGSGVFLLVVCFIDTDGYERLC